MTTTTDELLGWCQDAKQSAWPAEAAQLHGQCPATIDPIQWPDPARTGATYPLKGRRCSCICHTRPVV
jgi:hypothetical protein